MGLEYPNGYRNFFLKVNVSDPGLGSGTGGAFMTPSSLGRYVFGSEISYNKAPPRLPGLGC
jgi:hypothetical protein